MSQAVQGYFPLNHLDEVMSLVDYKYTLALNCSEFSLLSSERVLS